MSTHIVDKATWLDTITAPGFESTITDVMSRHAIYADLTMIDRWSVYQHDGFWYAINLDGTLRGSRPIKGVDA